MGLGLGLVLLKCCLCDAMHVPGRTLVQYVKLEHPGERENM